MAALVGASLAVPSARGLEPAATAAPAPAAVNASAAARQAPRSPIVYPLQSLPISFSHVLHLGRGTTCATCHAAATTSLRAGDDLMPGEAVCATCHDIDRSAPERTPRADRAPGRCGLCHVGFRPNETLARVIVPTPRLDFSHAIHAERGVACSRCHGDLAASGVGLATRQDLPTMSTCLGCHDRGQAAALACGACHPHGPSGRLDTDFAEGKLVPSGTLRGDRHDARFRTDHAAPGRDAAYCESCHKKAFCTDCHSGTLKPLDYHAGDYVRLHVYDARRGTSDCQTCHRLQSFCSGCHARVGVAGDARTGTFAPTRSPAPPRGAALFHPKGFADGQNPPAHAAAARRDLAACASCHREEFCVRCHGDRGGAGLDSTVNPHGAGWKGSSKCRTIEDKNPRVCLKCHLEGRTCDE
jgi:hypothetical protein